MVLGSLLLACFGFVSCGSWCCYYVFVGCGCCVDLVVVTVFRV